MQNKKIIIAITGASGSIYAKRTFHNLLKIKDKVKDIAVIYSKNALDVWQQELGETPDHPFKTYPQTDFKAPFASGSANYTDMLIVPCSMGTLARIASGISNDLITRTADVMLKERRRLILMVRDTPYNQIHLQNMLTLTQAGAIILPASPSFYSNPQDFNQLADTIVHRALDLMNLNVDGTFRWGL